MNLDFSAVPRMPDGRTAAEQIEEVAAKSEVVRVPMGPRSAGGTGRMMWHVFGAAADKPILLPWGLRDFVFDAAFLDRFIQAWPHAEVERYPDCGHYLMEDAGSRVVERIARFLTA
jgi:haloalkane dehalogenase